MIMSKPASSELTIPAVHEQWAAASRSAAWASSTPARSSATVYDGRYGIVLRVPPPVAIILSQSAPSLIIRRTLWRTASTPSASPPNGQQCPPVIVIGRPEIERRGPVMILRLSASLIEKVVRFIA